MKLERKQPVGRRQRKHPAIFTALCLLLAACNIGRETTGVPAGFIGGVAADEPRAALAGRDILAAGGSAADAVVATYLTMAVTLPSRAGLGGGGMCLAYDPRLNRVEALDFTARASTSGSASVPANVRGMLTLYGRQGRLRWEQLVAPAESFARFGVPVPRALAMDLAAAAPVLSRDDAARQVFLRADGTPLAEGDTLSQPELANFLTALRVHGGAELYQGALASRFAEAAALSGATITVEDMRAVAATPKPSIIVRHDDLVVHFAPPPAVVGIVEAELFAALAPRWRRTSADERAHLLAETELRVAQDRARWLAPDLSTRMPTATLVSAQHLDELMASYRADRRTASAPSGPLLQQRNVNTATAGVVAVDRDGGAVACSFTMNELFGLGRMAGRTGVLLAAAPDHAGRGPQMLGPVLAAMARGGRIVFGSTSSGGWPQASATVQVMLRTIVDGRPLEEAIDAARIHNPGDGDNVMVEAAVQARMPGLAPRGYDPSVVPVLGTVNAIFCPEGLFENAEACQFRADRRGFGLGIGG